MHQRHILYLAALLMDMSVAGVSFAISRRAAELGASALVLGLLGGVWIGVYAIGAVVAGRWSDRIGRRTLARAGCGLAAVMALACAFTTNIGLLLALSAVFGVSLAGFWPAVIAWVTEGAADSTAMNARLSKFSVAWNIGLLTGFAVTGFAFKYSPRLAFVISTTAMGAIVVLLSLPARADTPSERSTLHAPLSAEASAKAERSTVPTGRGFRKTAWLANFAIAMTGGGTSALFPQLATSLGIGADVHGGMLAVGRGMALLMFLALQFLVFWRTRLWPLWLAQAVAAAGIALIGWGTAPWMFAVAFGLAGAVSGYTYQASIFFTLEEMTEKGKGSGLHEAVLASGMFAGPLLAGWVGSHASVRAPYFFCAGVLVLLVLAQMVLVFLRRRATVGT